ncbi:MAG: P-loop NTPase fold protein [Polyangiales bacterium]
MPEVVWTEDGLRLLNDQPESEASALWNGLSTFADAVSRILDHLPSDSPILITGPWGSGKTTLLRALQRRIDKDPSVKQRTVWFEAWRCESEGVLLPALVRVVWQAATQDQAPSQELRDAFRLAFFIATRSLRLGLTAFGQKDLGDALGELDWKDLKEDFAALRSLTHGAPERDPMAELHERFAALLRAGWPELEKLERRPVIIIDDLDRCSPERTVAFIEQIRSIVAQSHGLPCTFIVAVDREVLVRAISAKFASIGDYDGQRYLEKVFPIAFALPVPEKNHAGELVLKLLTKQPLALAGISDDERQRWHEALGSALADASFATPRLMKRCINRFALIKHFERDVKLRPSDPLETEAEADITLAKWLAATERWPALRRTITLRREEWQRIEQGLGSTEQLTAASPDFAALVQERGAASWLRTEFLPNLQQGLGRFRAAELRLRRWGL